MFNFTGNMGMFRSFSNIRIFYRLLILFVVLTIISSTAIVFLDYFYLQASNNHAQAVKTSFDAQQITTEQQINLQRMNALLQARFAQIFANGSEKLHGDPSLAASGGLIENDIIGREINFDQTLSTYNSDYEIASSDNMSTVRSILESDDSNKHLITDQKTALDTVVANQWKAYKDLQDKVLQQLDSAAPLYQTAYSALYQANLNFQNLQQSWNVVLDTATVVGQAVTSLSNSEVVSLQIATIVAIVLTLFVIIATAFIVNSTISIPLRQLAALTGRIARGDTSERAHIEGRDEIHLVAVSMNTMLDNIVKLIKEAQHRHVTLQTQIDKLVREIQGIGEGDLRVHAEVTSDSLGTLAQSFNFMIAELGSIVIKFKTLANEVERATIQAYDDMLQLVDDSDKQIQHITTAKTYVEEMANASHYVVESARALTLVGDEARTATRNGQVSIIQTSQGIERISTNVGEAVSRVKELEKRSQEIDEIVRVISGIAHQTNRLALDSTIQAAVAGENGNGFRAVAEDIRRLSEFAKAQTYMIGKIVTQVIEDIQAVAHSMYETEIETTNGQKFSQEASIAFDAIVASIERQAQEIQTINHVAGKQSIISNSVLQAMQSLTTSTYESSESIHKEAQRMEDVAELAERLLTSAEVFKLHEGQDIFAQVSNNSSPLPQLSFAPQNSQPGFFQSGSQPGFGQQNAQPGFAQSGSQANPYYNAMPETRNTYLTQAGNTGERIPGIQTPTYAQQLPQKEQEGQHNLPPRRGTK